MYLKHTIIVENYMNIKLKLTHLRQQKTLSSLTTKAITITTRTILSFTRVGLTISILTAFPTPTVCGSLSKTTITRMRMTKTELFQLHIL